MGKEPDTAEVCGDAVRTPAETDTRAERRKMRMDNARTALRAYAERIERLEEEKQTFVEDIREVYAEAKAEGFDTKIMRMCLKLRKMDRADREEQEEILALYMSALD